MENKGILIYLVLLTITIIIVLIFMAVNTNKNHTEVTEQITEIKSKIGAVVRAFNINAIQDHNVNMQQQDEIEELEREIKRLSPKQTPMTYDQAIGRVPMNESEDTWNAIDVSRKAEKEISNSEWNSRTTKKLDMLKALNKAGKFKKEWDNETLQGWVDQNYSWEKLSRQFKNLKEGTCGYSQEAPGGKDLSTTR